jgi:hypothetical protein
LEKVSINTLAMENKKCCKLHGETSAANEISSRSIP